MDEEFNNQLKRNARRFLQCIDSIAEKYSKLEQYEDDAIEVDLDNTHIETLEHYMTLSKKNVNKLARSFADLKGESQPMQDSTRYSQLDYTCKERNDCFETTCSSEDDDTEIEATSHTVISLDESQGNDTVICNQPEDQDEQLEMSLLNQGSSLGELYPDMISQIGKTWRRQHVSETADSVLRRYRRWRKSNRIKMTNSFNAAQRPNKAKVTRKREGFNKINNPKSPVKSHASAIIKAGSPSPTKMVTNNYFSPMRREAPATEVVMDMSALGESHERKLNKTFTMYEPSLNYSKYSSSPSRSSYPSNGLSQDLSLRMKESCMSPRRMQTAGCSGHAAEKFSSPLRQSPYKSMSTIRTGFSEQTDIYGAHVRKSPFKLNSSRESPRQSPYGYVASPKYPYMMQSISREASRFKSASNIPSTSPKITVSRRTLEYSDLPLSPQQGSRQIGKPRRQHHGLRRHLSFDSYSLTLSRESYTTKDFDNDFLKLYHKLVCLNNSSHMQGHPCRFCAKNSDATRGHSFSNLAALALSPHRPLLRKRHRDLDINPQSKRFKEGHFTKYL